ncbi:MAG TPA: glycosyltransferase [Mycobacteriales bacterium]|nr:glycosyltransferase [Mycobacteriales bacterium]
MLFISHDMLWPAVGGGRIRCAKLLHRALDETRIDLVVVAPDADVSRHLTAVPDLSGLRTDVFVDESAPGPGPDRASGPATAHLRRLAVQGAGYDVVHLEGHYLLKLVPPELLARTVIVDHNIESQLLEQLAETGEPVSEDQIAILRGSEQRAWRLAGAVVALSPEDAAEMRRREPTVLPHLIPNGWDHLPAGSGKPDDEGYLVSPRLLFLADYDYPPNRDAFVWLVTDIFPRIREHIPGAHLVLAGVNLSPDLASLASECPGADIRGYVSDLPAELDRSDIVLCPLRIGGGVKVKVIEAIRRACLLVSTTVGGIEGIPEPLRSAVCFADDAAAFAGHVVRLCAAPQERRQRRAQLRNNQSAAPTWEESSVRMMQLWSQLSVSVDRTPRGRGTSSSSAVGE